jgi:hypothetical protein
MDMNQLFKRLPTELQWEILTEFVGTHVVRYNKLRRRMDGHIQSQLAERAKNSFFFDNLRFFLKQNACYFGDGNVPWYWTNPSNPSVFTVTQVVLGTKGNVFGLVKNIRTGELSYGFYSTSHKWYMTPINDSVTLSPYVKHQYPSYPYTNKKLKRKTGYQKVILYY